MKSGLPFFRPLALLVALSGVAHANPSEQPQVSFATTPDNIWSADWPGVYGQSYFPQGSLDLLTWHYLPLIEFSDGEKGVGGSVAGTGRYFFRLRHTDQPTTNPELHDFAGDGIGSLIKILMGLDPFVPLAWLDTDGDGIHDAIEQFWFGNLTTTNGAETDDADGNGIRDIFEMQAGADPTTDETAAPESRANYLYDPMGRLVGADGDTYVFDMEGNLESATTPPSE